MDDENRDENEKPRLVHDDRALLFALRYGYQPLPDVMDYTLCKEFKDALSDALKTGVLSSVVIPDRRNPEYKTSPPISEVLRTYLISIRGAKSSFSEPESITDIIYLLEAIVEKDEFYETLSLCELFLRSERIGSTRKNLIRNVFAQGLAPYAIDVSTDPHCIIPVDTPENGAAVVDALETLHEGGHVNGHGSLRDAAGHINGQKYGDGARSAVDALESVAKDVAADRSATLGDAIKTLKKRGILKDRPLLYDGLEKLGAFASDTVRHGQRSDRATEPIDRNEAVLIFCLCASLSAYLSRTENSHEGVGEE